MKDHPLHDCTLFLRTKHNTHLYMGAYIHYFCIHQRNRLQRQERQRRSIFQSSVSVVLSWAIRQYCAYTKTGQVQYPHI